MIYTFNFLIFYPYNSKAEYFVHKYYGHEYIRIYTNLNFNKTSSVYVYFRFNYFMCPVNLIYGDVECIFVEKKINCIDIFDIIDVINRIF